MRRRAKWGKTVLAIALAGAMSVTSVNVSAFTVFAADGVVQEAQTRSMSYDGTTLTASLENTDSVLNPGDGKEVEQVLFFYAVYDSIEAAKKDDVGKFFGKSGGAKVLTADADGGYHYSEQKAITKGQVVRYNFNVLYKNAGACEQTFQYYTYTDDSNSAEPVKETGITKLEVYDANNGPQIAYKKADNVFQFCLPKVNGAAIAKDTLDTVKMDI